MRSVTGWPARATDLRRVRTRRKFCSGETFEQRRAGEPVRPVQAGARRLADRGQVADIGAAIKVGMHSPARVVGRGHHRDGFARDIDAVAEATLVDARKSFADEFRRHGRKIEQRAGLTTRGQLLLDGARHDIARRQRTTRVHGVHETFTPGVDEHSALAAQRLGDEEPRGVLLREDRRMELHVFEIDEARTHAISHRHAVADAARLVGGMQKNLSQPAAREHRFFRNDRDHLAAAGIEHIGSETGERFVFVREVFRIVRERQQIDGNPADPADDARRGVDAARDGGKDRMPGRILRVDNAPFAMSAFAGVVE